MRAAILIFALLSLSVIANAQSGVRPSPTPRGDDQEPVRVFTEEVRLQVVATDTYGHYDPSLTIDDVLIIENGEQQQIKSLQHQPANVLLLLDVGNQLGLKSSELTRNAALSVIDHLFKGTRFAVMQFALKPELIQPWTTDKSDMEKIL